MRRPSPSETRYTVRGRRRRSNIALVGATALVIVGLVVALALDKTPARTITTESGLAQATTTLPATTTTMCADEKPSEPQGCWIEPPGYSPAPKTSNAFVPITDPAAPDVAANIPSGTISTELSGPFSSSDFLIENGWWNQTSTTQYIVYAGAVGSDQPQGVVVVLSRPLDDTDNSTATITPYDTAGQDGALTMVSTDGWTIELQASDGALYSFDVSTLSYTS